MIIMTWPPQVVRRPTGWSVERDFFNAGGIKGRTEFEYICSICGAPPEDSPLVADAVLGMRDGKKLLPCREEEAAGSSGDSRLSVGI